MPSMTEIETQIIRLIKEQSASNLPWLYSEIDSLLRNQRIFIPKIIVDGWSRDECTLKIDEVQTNISPEEFSNYYEIKANTVGPLYPADYSSNKYNPLILFLLKEPFIEKDSWLNNDRGGHNQVDIWLDKSYDTQRKALKYAEVFLNELNIKYENQDDYLKHLCVINVQFFPGLALKKSRTKDSFLKLWAEKNQIIIQTLVDLYNPKYIIGGNTLNYFINDKGNDKIILGEKILFRELKFKNYYFVSKSGRIYRCLSSQCSPI